MSGFTVFVRVVAIMLFLIPFRAVSLAQLDRQLSFSRRSIVQAISVVCQSTFLLVLAATGFGYWSFAIAMLTGHVFEALVLPYLAGWQPRLRWPGSQGWNFIAFGLHVSGASMLWFLYTNSSYAVVGRLDGPVLLGYFALAYQLATMPVRKLTANCNQIVYPLICRVREDRERTRDWFLRFTVMLGCVGIPALVGLALVADDAIGLVLGDQWRPVVEPFRLLSVAGVTMLLSSTLPPLFNAVGRPDINTRYALACLLVLPLGFFVLGSHFGVLGVCLAWAVLYPLLVAGTVVLTQRLTGVTLGALLNAQLPVLLSVGLMAAAVVAFRICWQYGQGWPRLGTSIGVGVLAYTLSLTLLARRTVLVEIQQLYVELRGKAGQS
jgi:O-antigen/teichoic acid export membrane protein